MTQDNFLTEILNLPLWKMHELSVNEKCFNVVLNNESHEKPTIILTLHFCCQSLQEELQEALNKLFPSYAIKIEQKITPHVVANNIPLRAGIKNIVAIASGKGGVGKSTIAVNLALALLAEGAKVGILDADIYGPSLPTMLNLTEPPQSLDGKTLEPMKSYGLQVMSIGCLLQEKDTAMVWRGPMASTALQQLFRDCQWSDLDYLIVDLPPGTGDIQLTLSQKIPVSGAVVVTTPQEVALADARKAITMFNKVSIPILGIVENMSYHICSHCGEREFIFDEIEKETVELGSSPSWDILGALPLTRAICGDVDKGFPTLVKEPCGAVSQLFKKIAMRLSINIATLEKAKFSRIPPIAKA